MNPFGANWKTSTTGYIETVCVIVIAMCMLPPEVWQNPKVWIPAVALLIAKTIKDTLTKDKNVTGGNTMQTLTGATVKKGSQTMVDQTLLATMKSGEEVTPEQERIAKTIL